MTRASSECICVEKIGVGKETSCLGLLRALDLKKDLIGVVLEYACFANKRNLTDRRDDDDNEPKNDTDGLLARLSLEVREEDERNGDGRERHTVLQLLRVAGEVVAEAVDEAVAHDGEERFARHGEDQTVHQLVPIPLVDRLAGVSLHLTSRLQANDNGLDERRKGVAVHTAIARRLAHEALEGDVLLAEIVGDAHHIAVLIEVAEALQDAFEEGVVPEQVGHVVRIEGFALQNRV